MRGASHGLALATAAVLAAPACDGGRSPDGAGGTASFERLSFSNEAGTRTYKLYVPSGYDGSPVPLVLELHGCEGDGDEEARWSRWNEVAEAHGFLVAYPEQSPDANGSRCWNWFLPDHQERGSGEPSILAGIAEEIAGTWSVDPRRVYVGGISAGGAMANVVAVTYPDVFAAAMVYAGCEYKGETCTAAVAAVPPELSGQWAYEAAGPHARVVPVIVVQGDQDAQVPWPNADLVVRQFLAADDWADDGANDGSVDREPSGTTSGEKPGGHTWDVDFYTDASGCLLAERWLVHGLGHAWSNGESNGSPRDELFTDPLGPDVTSRVYEFFASHPMPASGASCHEVPS